MRTRLLVALLALASSSARGETAPVEVWVEVRDPTVLATVRRLGLGFAEGRRGDWIRMDATAEMLRRLDRAGVRWQPARVRHAAPPAGYHDPDEMIRALDDLATRAPDLVTRFDLGDSVEGRRLAGVRISATDTPLARWRILGAHHGDELSSSELALAAATTLVEGYDRDAAITALLDRDEVWVVPIVNPDGVEAGIRYNADDVDLNRNYDYQWSGDEFRSGDAPFTEPETRAIRQVSLWTGFGAGLSMHSGATNLGWVWNYTTSPTPDAELLSQMADAYASASDIPGFWTTNGAEWYITHGDTNDWSYGRLGALDFTLEVSTDKTPPSSDLPTILEEHLPGVLAFLEWPSVAGVEVVDATTGMGIPAEITFQPYGWFAWTAPDGRLGRPIEGDAVTAEVQAPGYAPRTVDLTAGARTKVALWPETLALIRPNPVILSRSGDGIFTLDRDFSSLTLTRPGVTPLTATPVSGGWQVDPTSLLPGPWTIEADGEVAPRALFAGEVDEAVKVRKVTLDASAGTLRLDGAGFEVGSRAWALWGRSRALVPLSVLEESANTVVLDASALDAAEDPVDVVLFSGGRTVAVADVRGRASVDTAAPLGDTGQIADTGGPTTALPSDVRLVARCASVPIPAVWPAALAAVFGGATRRRRNLRRPR